MAKRKPAGVASSIVDHGKFHIRRLVIRRANGKYLVSYTMVRPNTLKSVVSDRRDWELICLLDGQELPMIPDPYSGSGWRISRELTKSELEKIACEPLYPLEEAS
jgi:hypothetical protein